MVFNGKAPKIFNPMGAWDETKTYLVADLVTYQGGSYIAILDVNTAGTAPTADTDHWMPVATPGDSPSFAITDIPGGKRIAITVGETVMTFDLFNGDVSATGIYPNLTAGDLVPKLTTPQQATSLFGMQTTGGDEDIQNGDAFLLSIRGYLDENKNPFNADTFVSTSMNLVDSSQYITIDGAKAYYFPVKKGEWGSYGTTAKNNGYVILNGTPAAVYFSTTKPTASSYGSTCGKTTYDGVDHYTPSADGWLVIKMSDDTVPACHITWNSKYDAVAGTFGNTTKNIAAAIAAVHPWGLSRLLGAEYSSFDEVNFNTGLGYPRNDRALLSGLTWSVATETSEGSETTTYVFTATISAMKSGGLWDSAYSGIEVSGNTLTIRSTSITTVEALQTAVSGIYFYYEKSSFSTVSIANASTLKANTVNDMGLTYFLLNGELVSVPAYVTEAFYQGGKDQLFNAVLRLALVEEIAASSLNELHTRLSSLDGKLSSGEIIETLLPALNKKWRRIAEIVAFFKQKGAGSPITAGIVPDYVGADYLDTTNKIHYEAFGDSAASDWVPLNS